jgi:hypothetical protein
MNMKMPKMPAAVAIVLFALLSTMAMAAQPTIIALQGKLTNTTTGAIIYSATLRVNVSDVDGITVWNQTYTNAVSAGFFDLLLGSSAENPLNLTYNENYNISVYAGDSPTQIGGSFRFRSSIGQISPSNLSAGDFSAQGSFSFGSTVVIDKTNNKVGIGTSVLTRFLNILGDVMVLGNLNASHINATVGNFSSIGLFSGNTVWHSGNDGSGSGLDADLLDGLSSASFVIGTNDSIALWNSSSASIYNRDFGKNVGIGTNAPTKTLSVNGTLAALTVDPSAFYPTINTTSGKNITIASSDGSVIIQLG